MGWGTLTLSCAREAFHNNRARVRRGKGKKLLRLRGERIERTFALACETGAHRRVRLRGRENVRKRYLAHVAALNLGLVMRTLFGHGTPRQAANAALAALIAALWMLYARIARLAQALLEARHGSQDRHRHPRRGLPPSR